MELSSFLRSTSKVFHQWVQNPMNVLDVVIGNNASDADSIISSIVYSFVLNKRKSDESQSVIPLLFIPYEKLRLRSEITELFLLSGIEPTVLPTVNEYLKQLQEGKERLNLHLVDHNVLPIELSGFENVCKAYLEFSIRKTPILLSFAMNVVEIIDHRKDEGLYPSITSANGRRIISYDFVLGRGVGSCCTLISETIKKDPSGLPLSEIAPLLEGVILLDTLNLSSTVNKTTQQDIDAVRWLQSFHSLNQDSIYQRLFDSKYDPKLWDLMTINDALTYDYKLFMKEGVRVGWSAILAPLEKFTNSRSFELEWKAFCKQQQLDVLIFSSLLHNCSPCREMQFIINNPEMSSTISEVEEKLVKKYSLSPGRDPHSWTTNQPISRKCLIPEIMEQFI